LKLHRDGADHQPVGRDPGRRREQPGVITARLDLSDIEKARGMVPSLKHDRPIDISPIDISPIDISPIDISPADISR